LFSQRIEEIFINNPSPKNLQVSIIDASKSNENDHPTTSRSYIVYTIKVADDLIVKRRYSEFENLRNILIKLFPTKIIPPIPEKQSLTSNLSLSGVTSTTSSLAHTSINNDNKKKHVDLDSSKNYIEYRRRMLTSFLNRCLRIDEIRENFVFLTFLDPHPNFTEFICSNEIGKLNKTSIYRLSPVDPLSKINDELYLTLPIPSDHQFVNGLQEDENKEQAEMFNKFESKFKDYELILSNISKINKSIVKHLSDVSNDFTELGSNFNSLSFEESSSNLVEKFGQVHDSSFLDINLLKNLINLKFIEKINELKNFIKIIRNLIEFNKRKWLQLLGIVKMISQTEEILKDFEKIESQSKKIDDALSKSSILNPPGKESKNNKISQAEPLEEDMEQELINQLSESNPTVNTAQTSTTSNKLFGYKIPGLKKFSNVLQSMTDTNPELTRKQTITRTKLKVLTLHKQFNLINNDNKFINEKINEELKNFQFWFKLELNNLCYNYNNDLKEFLNKNYESWE
ncbi:hypothetical protein PACTADRAFT_27049, partial [Pachysolen tannophilus NRRL Y-2460]